jgi:sugar/nucleoside kinase (ribokinase family)
MVGSVALDTVKTPLKEVKDVLGGSATYASYAASFFSPVKLVAVVGTDFPQKYIRLLEKREINLEGLERKKGKTFRWSARYEKDLNKRHTLKLDLNVFKNFRPSIPPGYRNNQYLFLSNIDPELQLGILKQAGKPKLVLADTIDHWIKSKRNLLLTLLKKTDIFLLNDEEARLLSGEYSLLKAARFLVLRGPQRVIIKKGEHGALMFSRSGCFALPGYPVEKVSDPTGAGDCFAGGFLGYLARKKNLRERDFRKGVIYGSVLASFVVEDFGLGRLCSLTLKEIEERYRKFEEMTEF